jgi:DNA-binding NarL/FixJ family response regulator
MRILIADDHPLIRIGLKELLTREIGAEVDEAASLDEAQDRLADGAARDLLILDLSMSSGNTFDWIPGVRQRYPGMGILVLSVHPEKQAGIRSILAGANGYLNKCGAPEQLVAAVRLIAEGKRYVSPELGSALADYLFRGRTDERDPHESLSERERTVLLKISEGLTTSEIAAALRLSPKTVGTYRTRILEKMGISTTAELTRYVVEKGLGAIPVRGPA